MDIKFIAYRNLTALSICFAPAAPSAADRVSYLIPLASVHPFTEFARRSVVRPFLDPFDRLLWTGCVESDSGLLLSSKTILAPLRLNRVMSYLFGQGIHALLRPARRGRRGAALAHLIPIISRYRSPDLGLSLFTLFSSSFRCLRSRLPFSFIRVWSQPSFHRHLCLSH